MILSKKNKFIFIKGKKVAGTSIEILLSSLCGPDDIVTPITPIDEKARFKETGICAQNYEASNNKHEAYLQKIKTNNSKELSNVVLPRGKYYNHMPLKEIQNINNEISADWLFFAAERDPYSKIISYANMQLKYKEYLKSGKPMLNDKKTLKQQLHKILENSSFMDVKNIELYKDTSGNFIPEIIRYENIESDLHNILNKLGLSNYPSLKHYKKGISANNLDPRSLFTKQHILQINEQFEEEFQIFNYKTL